MFEHGSPISFFDFDGTLASSNVVTQYAFLVKRLPSRTRARLEFAKLLLRVPLYLVLDVYSRRAFNRVFFRAYRGRDENWLRSLAEELFENAIRPTIFPGALDLVKADRAAGFRTVLVTGSLDFALAPVVRHFGFDDVICNSLAFNRGRATGEVAGTLIAETEKVKAMQTLCGRQGVDPAECKAYSDSWSDVPMLEAVGLPSVVHPDRRLRRLALLRGWPVLDLRKQ